MVVVIIGPEPKTSPLGKSDASKDFEGPEDAGIYGSHEDMNEEDAGDHDDASHYDVVRDDAIQNEKNEMHAYQSQHDDTIHTDVTKTDGSNDVRDDDDDNTSDSGVSQVTTQEATSASPSTPRLAERTLGMMNDDAASTTSSCVSLAERTVVDAVNTSPSGSRLSDTEGTLVAYSGAINAFPSASKLTDTKGTLVAYNGTAKESTCVTLPVSGGHWLPGYHLRFGVKARQKMFSV